MRLSTLFSDPKEMTIGYYYYSGDDRAEPYGVMSFECLDLNFGWYMSRWELFVLGLKAIRAAVRR